MNRTLDQIPLPPGEKPKAYEIKMLELGHFIAAIDGKVYRVYAIPSWQKFNDALELTFFSEMPSRPD